MITIRIGNETRDYANASESWVNQQLQQASHSGQKVCVSVTINTGGINLVLATPGCGGGGGGGRAPNATEREVLDLWHQRHLDEAAFGSGNVVAFLKQLKRWVA